MEITKYTIVIIEEVSSGLIVKCAICSGNGESCSVCGGIGILKCAPHVKELEL